MSLQAREVCFELAILQNCIITLCCKNLRGERVVDMYLQFTDTIKIFIVGSKTKNVSLLSV